MASMRSESSQLIDPPNSGDQYGFNQPIVDAMKAKYNVDILTDPRFDYKSPSFNIHDPMVENWRDLRGTYITQLYREIRQAMKAADPNVKFAVCLSGEYVGPIIGNAKLEWRKWIDEGIVDAIALPVTFEATYDLDASNKGYLTDVRAGVGSVTTDEVKQYILHSAHPEIKVIETGAPAYFYPPPARGADAWQCDIWYDTYDIAWAQRWQQWMSDLRQTGSIKFFAQTFDDFPVKSTGISGGYGDGRYNPDLHACPGVWYPLGDGSSALAYVQQDVHRGDTGNAIELTGKDVMAVHQCCPDRSLYAGTNDTAIANGKATFSFWINRQTAQSALTVYFTGTTNYEKDVAVRVEPGSGNLSYADHSNWVKTDQVVPVGTWSEITIEVNLDAMTYSAEFGESRSPICHDIGIAPAVKRFVELNGVNQQIEVPSYRIFNALMFVPPEGQKDAVYLDDVSVDWVPTLYFSEPGKRSFLADTFENDSVGSSDFGSNWHVENPTDSQRSFFIQNTTSFGSGVKCVEANGGGKLTADFGQQLTPASANGKIVLDLDVFLRSNKDYPYLLPDPSTRSAHSFSISFQPSGSDSAFVSIDNNGGTWRLWNGTQFIDTGKLVTYDVWQHLQVAVDLNSKTYALVAQPVGGLPTPIGSTGFSNTLDNNQSIQLVIKPSKEPDHISCYDNVVVTSN